jgi:hypothetical protein
MRHDGWLGLLEREGGLLGHDVLGLLVRDMLGLLMR